MIGFTSTFQQNVGLARAGAADQGALPEKS